MSNYPLKMWHPGFKPAVCADRSKDLSARSSSVKFPPVVVRTAEDEEFHRAKGYFADGEAPPPTADFSEYPLTLYKEYPRVKVKNRDGEQYFLRLGYRRESFRPLTMMRDKATQIANSEEEKLQLMRFGFKVQMEDGMQEYSEYPLMMVKDKEQKIVSSKEQEQKFLAQGFKRPGKADPKSFERAAAMPDPDVITQEWPKMVDGVLMQDPNTPAVFQEYPKWVGKVLVRNKKEEEALKAFLAEKEATGTKESA